MIRKHTLALGLSACFILSGCNDKIEEANQASASAAVQTPAQAVDAQAAAELPVLDLSAKEKPMAKEKGELTVADVYSKKQSLNGKVITVTGNVVKVSDGIMGKSWIHIQDGTGGKETNDLVFTSATQSATVGDHVTAKGTVSIDKDFGYGYFYPVIVEEATFSN